MRRNQQKQELSQAEKQKILNAQKEAKRMLEDRRLFNKNYDETFALFDKDKDGCIDQGEYIAFLEHMYKKMGKTNINFPVALMNFDRADSDKNGSISKEEFKTEFSKRLREFTHKIIK